MHAEKENLIDTKKLIFIKTRKGYEIAYNREILEYVKTGKARLCWPGQFTPWLKLEGQRLSKIYYKHKTNQAPVVQKGG